MTGSLPSAPARSRRILRVSLRALMLLIVILGGALGWVTHRARVQRHAVEAVVRGGGSVFYDWQLRPAARGGRRYDPKAQPPGPRWLVDRVGIDYFSDVSTINLGPRDPDSVLAQVGRLSRLDTLSSGPPHPVKITRAGLSHLRNLTALTYLDLGDAEMSGPDLAHLKPLTHLKIIRLPRKMPIADADLAHLSGLNQLEQLSLPWGPGVTDQGLAHLEALVNMKKLWLFRHKVTGAGLAHLRRMTKLEFLDLGQTRVETLAPIANLRELTRLQLVGVPINDAGLAPVAGFRKMRSLILLDTHISDAGLAHLAELEQLERLELIGNRLTDRGLKNLKRLKGLRHFRLENARVDGSGLQDLGDLPVLQSLSLNLTGMTDAALSALSNFPALASLTLASTRVTDRGLKQLATLKTLTHLQLSNTRITDAGLAHLAVFPRSTGSTSGARKSPTAGLFTWRGSKA